MSGCTLGYLLAKRIPAAAASVEPSTKVKEITRSTLIPISAAVSGLKLTARIARPMRVWKTMNCRMYMSGTATSTVTAST